MTVGLSIDKASGMSISLTVMPGNVVDLTHFKGTFKHMQPLLPGSVMIVFDNVTYSMENSALLGREGFGFVTHLQMNTSDDASVKSHEEEFIELDNEIGMSFLVCRAIWDARGSYSAVRGCVTISR